MKIAGARIRDFKRFTDLTLTDIPSEARLVLLVGPNGTGKSSLFEAFNYWMVQVRQNVNFDPLYHVKVGGPLSSNWNEMFRRIEVFFHGYSGDPRTWP
jgi:AAA15 family ATPase/GTPase